MSNPTYAISSIAVALTFAFSHASMAGDMAAPGMGEKPAASSAGDKKMIRSAMSAAPKRVSEGAAIVAMDANGKMRTLREGKNGFTCMADNPATPGPDPMCMDKAALEWAEAWIGHTPPARKVGFMYMLAGGTDASNTDPFATTPGASTIGSRPGPT